MSTSDVEYEEAPALHGADGMGGGLGNDEIPLKLCYQQLEHEGGAFWCTLPLGHAGPHEPQKFEQGYQKRQRAPPKRLSEEPPQEPPKKKVQKPPPTEAEPFDGLGLGNGDGEGEDGARSDPRRPADHASRAPGRT